MENDFSTLHKNIKEQTLKKNKNLSINISGITMKNPVTTASGTFGSGKEFKEFINLNKLGAITVKGVASIPWKGNDTPRIAETYGGMLNSVGLQNLGAECFIENDIPFLRQYDTRIIVNICGHTIEQYCQVAEKFSNQDIDLLELNISCPNVTEGGITFGTDAKMVQKVVSEVKKYAKQPLIVKLTPNVTDITEIAKAAVYGGADALSLINTLQGMKIDIYKRKAVLANKIGGYSGPAIKPVAVRMVYQVSKAVDVPIIGMGGISNSEDAIEFIMAGATAIAVGTANFSNPMITMEIIEGIEKYMECHNIKDIKDIRGIID
ncbi:dihydroorotate dehydrogenase [Clostridium sp. MD294]|uniref:dihydroorotate dehydrogenase n=2 Tax=Clostridium sp. MD294 TaxID=97138 RepID=UPI0002C90FA6|nr:dihydroorotate dehydrogenase [Clostridium sp. MD294]NDO45669.1 dihydroorotate dehydrogenase [Clostridium sp. MD294]USF30677.1 Dihydroorotate dehydrogenase B (NAD(+)), catalytic subunit [Clostridium sp. MD294]